MFRIILIITLFFGLQTVGFGQAIYTYQEKGQGRGFWVDYTQFRSDEEGLNRFEIYYKLSTGNLTYRKIDDGYKASYEVAISIYGDNNQLVTSRIREKEVIVHQYARTFSPLDFRTGQMNFNLPPDKYRIEYQFTDKNSSETYKNSFKTKKYEYSKRNLQISDIEFVFAIDTAQYDSVFIKADMSFIPEVRRIFGGDTSAVLLYYFEIYRGESETEKVRIETRLLDRRLNTVYHDTVSQEFNDDILKQIRRVTLKDLKSGEYTLEVILKGHRNRAIDDIEKTFFVRWLPETVVYNDYKTTLKQLGYIATSEEMEILKRAETAEEKMKAWSTFWLNHDPSLGTEENEAKNGFYNKIDIANQKFSIMKREGWQTDRGMIFIKYGEPDQVEDFPFELNQQASQVWYYYHAFSKVREFVFVDEWGNNDYILQYPYDGIRY